MKIIVYVKTIRSGPLYAERDVFQAFTAEILVQQFNYRRYVEALGPTI